MAIELRGLPIAITGASSGIGMETALACARAGMPVALGARREDRLRQVAERIKGEGGRAIAVACDVTRPAECERLVAETVREFGSIYSIFANAGYGIEGEAHATSDAEMRAIFETNFFGTLNTLRPAIPLMLESGRGHVIICSSVVSKMGIPTLSAYSATKAAQDHIARGMRVELRGKVHVSSVHPIGTDTEFSKTLEERGAGRKRTARTPDGWRQSADYVAGTIVACLRRPRGEVWPSTPARVLAAVGTLFPGFADWMLGRHLDKQTK